MKVISFDILVKYKNKFKPNPKYIIVTTPVKEITVGIHI